jgi:hypothetical protein
LDLKFSRRWLRRAVSSGTYRSVVLSKSTDVSEEQAELCYLLRAGLLLWLIRRP